MEHRIEPTTKEATAEHQKALSDFIKTTLQQNESAMGFTLSGLSFMDSVEEVRDVTNQALPKQVQLIIQNGAIIGITVVYDKQDGHPLFISITEPALSKYLEIKK